MKTFIKIDRKTIKKNPKPYGFPLKVLGAMSITFEGIGKIPDYFIGNDLVFIKDIFYNPETGLVESYSGVLLNEDLISKITIDQNIKITIDNKYEEVSGLPGPKYYYDYAPSELECKNCKSKFQSNELKYDNREDYDGEDEYYSSSDTICPVCGEWDCCDVEFEEFKEEMIKSTNDN